VLCIRTAWVPPHQATRRYYPDQDLR
jgi:hypothetical protein